MLTLVQQNSHFHVMASARRKHLAAVRVVETVGGANDGLVGLLKEPANTRPDLDAHPQLHCRQGSEGYRPRVQRSSRR